MTQPTPFEIVTAYHQAWTSGNVDAAMDYLAQDFTCRAPGVDFTEIEPYREFIAAFAPSLTGTPEITHFAEDDRVALFYYPQTAGTSTTPAAEFFTVTDGLIRSSVLIFDRLSYSPPTNEQS